MTTDDQLRRDSDELLEKVRELRRLEDEKRRTARSTDDFHDLAQAVERKSLEIWDSARSEREDGVHDSPIAAERDEQEPGDWTDGSLG